jgi:hypothetical protein
VRISRDLWAYVCPWWCDAHDHEPAGIYSTQAFDPGPLAEPVHRRELGSVISGRQALTVDVVAMASESRPVVMVGGHEVASAASTRALAHMLLAAADLVEAIETGRY